MSQLTTLNQRSGLPLSGPRGLAVTAAAVAAIVAGVVFAIVRTGGADESRPVPDHALAGSADIGKAFAELAGRAGLNVAMPASPDGLVPAAVALEPGPPGSAAGTLVLDYYAGPAPKDAAALAAYAGPRVQVIYRPGAGAPPAGGAVLSLDGRDIAVQRAEGAAVYYVPFAGGLAEVRSWSTGSEPAPSDEALAPLLASIK
jgi:hypothetical protein